MRGSISTVCVSFCFVLATVTNVTLQVISESSVRVSWNALDYIPEIIHYTIVYGMTGNMSEGFVMVPSSLSSVVIEGLSGNKEYQFQVVATAELDGEVLVGERSSSSVIIVTLLPVTNPTTDGKCMLHCMYVHV